MKIGSLEAKSVVPAPTNERKTGTAPAGSVDEASAKVELSSAAVAGKDADDQAFDVQKVQSVSAAIRDGTFKVNANAIADKLISNAEELLGRKLS